MTSESDYSEWLNDRRVVRPPDDLVDRIMARINHEGLTPGLDVALPPDGPQTAQGRQTGSSGVANGDAISQRAHVPRRQLGPMLFWAAASLIFAIRIAALVGNLAFPTSSYPEFAGDEQIEEAPHDHRNISRS